MSTEDQNDLWGGEPANDMFGEEEAAGPDLFGDTPSPAPPSVEAPAVAGAARSAEAPETIVATAPVSAAKAQQDGYVVLARKYRPQTFDDLVGQDSVQQALRGAIATGQISHAYLFSGPRGTGKTSTARILAKAVNCQEGGPRPDPCGKCSSCRSITVGSSLDVIEIDAASNTGVDNIRDLKSGVVLAPFSRYKVYIVDEVHMLSNQAFNALLKTLEEPPPQVIFVLATTELHKVPETIISRCQTFLFRRFSLTELKGQLGHILDIETQARGIEITDEDREQILDLIARSAEGGMRDAQVTLDQVLVLSKGHLDFESVRRFLGIADNKALDTFVESLYNKESVQLLELIEELVAQGQDLELFVKSASEHMRDLLLVRTAGRDTSFINVSEDRALELERLANAVSPAFLIGAIEQFIKLVGEMKVSGQPRIMLELAVLKLTVVTPGAEIDDILRRLAALEAGGGGGGGGGGGAAQPSRESGAGHAPASAPRPVAAPPRDARERNEAPAPSVVREAPQEYRAEQRADARAEATEVERPTGKSQPVAGAPADPDQIVEMLSARLQVASPMLHMALQRVFCGHEFDGRLLTLYVCGTPKMPSQQVTRQTAVLAEVVQELYGSEVTLKVAVREDVTDSQPFGGTGGGANTIVRASSPPVQAAHPEEVTPQPLRRAVEAETEPAPAKQANGRPVKDGPVIYYPQEIREKAMRELSGAERERLLAKDQKMKDLVDKAKAVFGIDDKAMKFLRSTLA